MRVEDVNSTPALCKQGRHNMHSSEKQCETTDVSMSADATYKVLESFCKARMIFHDVQVEWCDW